MPITFVPIAKVDKDLQIVKGPALRPEIRDRQGTIVSADVIRKAAHGFMSAPKAGFMHDDFTKKLTIVESWITDIDLVYPSETRKLDDDTVLEEIKIPAGSWMIAMRVDDPEIWKGVLNRTFKGFSIGGRAKISYEEDAADGT